MPILFANQLMTVSRAQVFNCRPAGNNDSDAPGLGILVHCEEMCFGCWYAWSTGGRRNETWKDFHLACSSNGLQIGNWDSWNGVATVDVMGEYPWKVHDFGAQSLSRHCRWRTGVVSTAEIEFYSQLPVGDTDNTTWWALSTYIGPWANLGGHNARGGRDL